MDTDPTESSRDGAADVDRSRYHHRRPRSADAVRPGHVIDDNLRSTAADEGEDHRSAVDLDRRNGGGFQRRRLGQLQLKHRLAIDLPENSPATRGTQLEQSDGQATSVAGRHQNEPVLCSVWITLDDCDCQFYVVFVVALATLAVALNVPPSWLILVVACLSLLNFRIDERRRAKPR